MMTKMFDGGHSMHWPKTQMKQFADLRLHKSQSRLTGSIIHLFVENYKSGDEVLIRESIHLPTDPCELHWLLMDVIKVLENNPGVDCTDLAVITYGSTPCQNCRFYAARLLHAQAVAPSWLASECPYDAEEQCRALFE